MPKKKLRRIQRCKSPKNLGRKNSPCTKTIEGIRTTNPYSAKPDDLQTYLPYLKKHDLSEEQKIGFIGTSLCLVESVLTKKYLSGKN